MATVAPRWRHRHSINDRHASEARVIVDLLG
jgi:hypothetical protein